MNHLQSVLNRDVATLLRHTVYANRSVTVAGESNVPTIGAAILAPIHTSLDDGYLLLAYSKRPLSVVKRYDHQGNVGMQLFEQLRMAAACTVGSVIIDRSITDGANSFISSLARPHIPTLRQFSASAQNVLRDGQLLCMFPQGERRPRSEIGELSRGIGTLALLANSPIIPTDIHYNGHTVAITYGEPITPTGNSRQIVAKLRDRLAAFTQR